MRHLWRAIGAGALVCALAACSSGGGKAATPTGETTSSAAPGPTTTTTPAIPSAATTAAVRAWFASSTGVLTKTYLRASAALATGHVPDRATCQHFTSEIQKVEPSPSTMLDLVSTAPDTRLVRLLRNDVATKFYMLSVCSRGPENAEMGPILLANWKALNARLRLEGVTY